MKRSTITLTQDALILSGRKPIPKAKIAALSFCPGALIQKGNRELEDRNRSTVLALDFTEPLEGLLHKEPFLLVPLAEDTDWDALTQWAGSLFRSHVDPASFQADSVLVEAKIKVNDYTRAATAGTNAYGKIGMNSPIIDVDFDLARKNIHLRYLGTNSKMVVSKYFKAHPEHDFSYGDAELVRPVFSLHMGRITASMELEYPSIERDEQGRGIWYLQANQKFVSATEACAWLRTLHKETSESALKNVAATGPAESAQETLAEPAPAESGHQKTAPHPAESSTEDTAPHFSKEISDGLLADLESLYQAGILSDLEYQSKKALILSMTILY